VDTGIDRGDLGELLAAFNEVTARLQSTHEALTAEVARLQGELRSANHRLRRAQELAALGEMAAGIAHEIRNPLGSIRLYARALEEDLTAMPDQHTLARKIGGAVRGLDAIVSDVLTFSREIRVQARPVDVADLIDRAVASCADLLEETGARVVTPTEDADAQALCDPFLTHQALTNIVRNALEAVAEVGGEREVRIDAARCSAQRAVGAPRAMVTLTVHDTGPGVPKDVMERMFNPFFTTRSAGTGLGLAIVHRIADAHDGRVTVRNHDDGGAVVELMLPVAPPGESNEPITTTRRALACAEGGDA